MFGIFLKLRGDTGAGGGKHHVTGGAGHVELAQVQALRKGRDVRSPLAIESAPGEEWRALLDGA